MKKPSWGFPSNGSGLHPQTQQTALRENAAVLVSSGEESVGSASIGADDALEATVRVSAGNLVERDSAASVARCCALACSGAGC